MLPEGGPAPHFGGRFSVRVTQKRFKIIGKQLLLKSPATQQIRARPAGPKCASGVRPPRKARMRKTIGRAKGNEGFPGGARISP